MSPPSHFPHSKSFPRLPINDPPPSYASLDQDPSLSQRRPKHPRSSSNEFGTFRSSNFLFTPIPPAPPPIPPPFPAKKSASSPLLHSPDHSYTYQRYYIPYRSQMDLDSEEERDDGVIYTLCPDRKSSSSSSSSLRPRTLGMSSSNIPSMRPRDKPKSISTAPGCVGAGETETEADEPPKHLPTARIIAASSPLIPPNTLQQRLTPLLFESSRLLSIVPAVLGTLSNLYQAYRPPGTVDVSARSPPERIDYIVSALWAILTGIQCLALTTGLLTRWRLYYPPLSTLIRLLALQAICWPATHFTLQVLEHEKRPVIVWAVVATTTCMSRSVQIWVTSNLWWERRREVPDGGGRMGGYWRMLGGGKWGGRRWDWKEVGVKCVLPAGVLYFVMAWAEALRREWSSC